MIPSRVVFFSLCFVGSLACGSSASSPDTGSEATGGAGVGSGGVGNSAGAPSTSGAAGKSGAAAAAGASGTGVSGSTGSAGSAGVSMLAASRIAVGVEYGCAINSAQAIECWGMPQTPLGETTPPAGKFKSLSAMLDVTCALATSGGVSCWGNLSASGFTVGASDSAAALDVGLSELCLLSPKDSSISCRGATNEVNLSAPSGAFQQLSVGRELACALSPDGTISCWGGTGAAVVAPAGHFLQVEVGEWHACTIALDGSASCWGRGDAAYANDGTGDAYGQAVAPTGVKFKKLAAGVVTTCGILDSGSVMCWGAGKTADNCDTLVNCGQALPPPGVFVDIAVGYTNACGILDSGKIACWGSNTGGRSTPPADFQ
jgi:Regulator of chromosome condensation (RCC1) repeat